jgi:hypothetical protein
VWPMSLIGKGLQLLPGPRHARDRIGRKADQLNHFWQPSSSKVRKNLICTFQSGVLIQSANDFDIGAILSAWTVIVPTHFPGVRNLRSSRQETSTVPLPRAPGPGLETKPRETRLRPAQTGRR